MSLHVSAIILAAGKSTRMGQPKQLLPLHGLPLIEHCLRSVTSGGVDTVILVTGDLHDELTAIASVYDVRTVHNAEPDGDMASSVRAGLAALPDKTSGVLIQPGDYPIVRPETIAAILLRHRQSPGRIVIPTYGDRRGHPVLFPRARLEALTSEKTLRDIIKAQAESVRVIAVNDHGILQDVDTPADYALLLTPLKNPCNPE